MDRESRRHFLVAVVDDDESVRESLPDLLRESGYAAQAFASAEELLDSGDLVGFGCLILDIAMPGMDGFQVAEALVADEATAAIPIIFLTARADLGDLLHGYEAGGVEYVTKPFELATLVAVVRRQLERAAAGSQTSADERAARIGALRLLLGIA